MFWLVLVLTTLVCLHQYQRMLNRRERAMLAHLPSWTPLPFIGSAYKFFADGSNFIKYYAEISAVIEATNLPFLIWIGHKGCIVLSDPEEIRAVSTTNLDKSYLYTFADILVGEGLITAPGEIWKRNIKKLGSAFKTSTINSYQETFNYQSQKLVKSLRSEVNGAFCDIHHKYLSNTTFRALCESFFGVHGDDDIIDEKLAQSFVRASELMIDRTLNICFHFEAVYRLTSAYEEFQRCMNTIKNMTETVLKTKLNDMDKCNLNKEDQDCRKSSTKSFLDILLEMKSMDPPMTDEEIKFELTTLLIAGHETCAIKCIFGETKRPVSNEDLISLRYCEAVVLETLRLYPPVPGVLRYVDHDVHLQSCTIPSGVTCHFNIWGSGRSKRIWGEDALKYKPERWLEPSSKQASSLLSFSIGKRACIGKHYAMNLTKTILVHIIREYEFVSEADKMTFTIDILLQPKEKNLIKIRKRGNIYPCVTMDT